MLSYLSFSSSSTFFLSSINLKKKKNFSFKIFKEMSDEKKKINVERENNFVRTESLSQSDVIRLF